MARPEFGPDDFSLNDFLATLKRWVEIETPSSDAAAVNLLVDQVERFATQAALTTRRISGRNGVGDILVLSTTPEPRKGTLVLAHFDTVHPKGTLQAGFGWREAGNKVEGPGVYDMKAGLLMALEAMKRVALRNNPPPVMMVIVPDEEIGSFFSRPFIEDYARYANISLVVEPARDGGKIVTARKGTGCFDIRVTGKASHAGMNPELGRNAVVEAARIALACDALNDPRRGITVTAGTIRGGTARNVIPAECLIEVDFRFPDHDSANTLLRWFHNLKPHMAGIKIEVTGGISRPPFFPTREGQALFWHARAIAETLGINLEGVTTGGGSDGNFTAALGIPTLDGLGADGAGAHTLHEYILTDSILPRTALLANLMTTVHKM